MIEYLGMIFLDYNTIILVACLDWEILLLNL